MATSAQTEAREKMLATLSPEAADRLRRLFRVEDLCAAETKTALVMWASTVITNRAEILAKTPAEIDEIIDKQLLALRSFRKSAKSENSWRRFNSTMERLLNPPRKRRRKRKVRP